MKERDPNVHAILGSICPTAVTDVPAVTDVIIELHEAYKHLGKPIYYGVPGRRRVPAGNYEAP